MSILAELLLFMKIRKRYWLWPVIIACVLFGALLLLAQTSAIAPFIYTVF